MHIYPHQDELDLTEAIFHENIHARCPDLDEDAVDEACQAAMRLLRRMGVKISFEKQRG
jgi:hypothetical protein